VPQIHPDIKTCWTINSPKGCLTALRQIHQLIRDLFYSRIEIWHMLVRHDKKVTADVWIKIQNNESLCPTVHDQIALIIRRVRFDIAKDTAIRS
jgi:hypothetical protein